ncbi:DUF6220 domain-containing protein [Microtetraspora sp. NBRC 16547]|uniref:DUF6220 domain-containing protein n=1 Tax=Microtetraspora sp. NBRC 16547 TaxID=3030993 RepID=UPI0024A33987|nr:DUF6220 domain-containing protein [Microtetraspora sp. NBRC 16547]GLW97413.1 hypothetical protein Misp02_15000 [Microtetraspora sp. NBRC 16547]
MRKAYFGFTVVLLISVLAQFYFATFGAFERPVPAAGAEGAMINYHAMNGTMVIPVLSLLTTIVAAIARAGGKQIGLAITPLLLVVVQLFGIFSLAEALGTTQDKTNTAGLIVLGFHALDGVALLGVAVLLVRGAHALMKGTATAAASARARVAGSA